jgi:hypothetical protein
MEGRTMSITCYIPRGNGGDADLYVFEQADGCAKLSVDWDSCCHSESRVIILTAEQRALLAKALQGWPQAEGATK